LVLFFVMDIEQSPTYIALPEHAKPAWLGAIRALPPARLVAPATGEVFEGKEDCHQRLQGWGLFEGFGVVQGRVWKDGAPRWEFKCKLHGTRTPNTCGLELKNKEDKTVTDRQRNKMVEAKKDCGFNYLLSHKAVNKDSEEKEYTRTLKSLARRRPTVRLMPQG
jgi:hypothetical protein